MTRVSVGFGVVLAAVAVLATPACKGGGSASAQQVVAGAPAGDVTEVSGDVRATRDGKTRPIAKGDVVSGDDVIATGGDGRVTIVLRHNHVPWSLGPNKEKKVADSAAWSAAAGASGETVSDDKSTAAGRHAERSATDTGASTESAHVDTSAVAAGSPAAPPPTTAAAAPPPPEQPGAPPAPPTVQPTAPPAATRQPTDSDKNAADQLGAALGGTQAVGGAPDRGTGGEGGVGMNGMGETGGMGGMGAPNGRTAPGGGGPIPRLTIGGVGASGGLDGDAVNRGLHIRAGGLKACYVKALQQNPSLAGMLEITLDIAADGKVVKAQVDGPSDLAAAEACMRRQLLAARFPAAQDATHASAKIVLAPESS
jgi:hypothetical protein